jgi:hypothetical protein
MLEANIAACDQIDDLRQRAPLIYRLAYPAAYLKT